ncbi:Crp/Fnr family transcriptional regulator [Leisingera sp. McT4-56]|uniref:Crp/Fnr family transcriptional regulator n=1 Tax=Leisingera sp. McT4-56 TaxID=2881255 RepID=UPI001CF87731|nr:Crp/Fnr family transcriptional regulator [Leisingera sp. McT4-56]MCB4457874.1 Crp/Fnr family transcriptional regulator [Leisingera sp. McT4-56]
MLGSGSLSHLASRSFRAHYKQGASISVQGEEAGNIGILVSGLVKVFLITEDGEELLLQILGPGQLIGELNAVENAFSWEAAVPAEVCWVARSTFQDFQSERPQIFFAYLSALEHQLTEHRLWAAALRGRTSLQRIAYWLVQQMPMGTGTGAPEIEVILTRRDVASFLNMTVETLCRGLHQLADRGVISLQASNRFRVTNKSELQALADFGQPRTRPAAEAVKHLLRAVPRAGSREKKRFGPGRKRVTCQLRKQAAATATDIGSCRQ